MRDFIGCRKQPQRSSSFELSVCRLPTSNRSALVSPSIINQPTDRFSFPPLSIVSTRHGQLRYTAIVFLCLSPTERPRPPPHTSQDELHYSSGAFDAHPSQGGFAARQWLFQVLSFPANGRLLYRLLRLRYVVLIDTPSHIPRQTEHVRRPEWPERKTERGPAGRYTSRESPIGTGE